MNSTPSSSRLRRDFARVVAGGVLGASLAGPVAAAAAVSAAPRRKNTLHHVGGESRSAGLSPAADRVSAGT